MSTDQLEQAIRATPRDDAERIVDASLSHQRPPQRITEPPRRRPSWLAPALAAAAVLALAAGLGVLLSASRNANHRAMSAAAGNASSLRGTLRLVAITISGRTEDVPQRPPVTLTFNSDGTVLVNDGVNAVVDSVQVGNGSLIARFRSTTYVLDGGTTDPHRRSVLDLLNSIPPSSTPGTPTRSTYQLQGNNLTIRTPAGQLTLTWSGPVSTEPPVTSSSAGMQ